MTRRAVLYARKSMKIDRGAEQSASVEDQLLGAREYATRRGCDVIAEFSDDGKSGLLSRSKRKGLDAALSMLERGEADTLVMRWKSRLSRDELERALILRDLERLAVEWHAYDDGGLVDRSTYAGYIKDKADEMIDTGHSKRVRQNWQTVHQARLTAGLPKSTSARFGYRYDYDVTSTGRRTGGRYVKHEPEADVVRRLYREYTRDDGAGFSQLVRWLNADGWRVAGTGNEWTVRTLSRFLDSGFAAGFISREEGLRDKHRGSHEPLITEAQWHAYRARRERQAGLGRKASGAGERWWLAGLVRCGRCGGSTFVDSFQRDRSSVLCSTHRANRTACAGTSILRTYVDGAVALWLVAYVDQLEALGEAEKGSTAEAATTVFQDAVAARDKIADGLADLEVKDALGDISPIVYRRAKDQLTVRLRGAEQDVKYAAAALQKSTPDPQRLREGADAGWTADHRAALRGVIDRIEVTPAGLTIYPVTGEPLTRTRDDLARRCGISGCDRLAYTRGLCKSHTMRARKVSADCFDALAQRVADEDRPSPTTDDVEAFLGTSV